MFSSFGFGKKHRKHTQNDKTSRKPRRTRRRFEALEDRHVLSGYSVTNLNDSGAGSLRQAILSANAHVGSDTIDFAVAGTIQLSSALPNITDAVSINGASAPGFAGAPVVGIDFNNQSGLRFVAGSSGSRLSALSLTDSKDNGLTLNAVQQLFITGNYIGLALDGSASANRGHGVAFVNASYNTIGGPDAQSRNVISANALDGVNFAGSFNNDIVGNYIGTDVTGMLARGNLQDGIQITGGKQNAIGRAVGNVISANGGNGLLLNGDTIENVVRENLIGVTAAGATALGNQLDGVRLDGARRNLIGQVADNVEVAYYNADNVDMQPVSAWQGIRGTDTSGQYLMAGTSNNDGLLFVGDIEGNGDSYTVKYPNSYTTSVYGPDTLQNGELRLVGSYKNTDYASAPVEVNGFVFEGTSAELSQSANYHTISYSGSKFNFVHSTMGGLAVGNYDSPLAHGSYNLPLGPIHAYIYDIASDTFLTDIVFPNAVSNTAYGIWHNGGTSYTICGGYSLDPVNNFDDQDRAIGKAYLVDYDSATGQFSHWTSFDYPFGNNFVTHFEGISSVSKNVYTMNADSVQSGSANPLQGSWVSVTRNVDGSFGQARWVDLNYPNLDPATNISSSNSVYGNAVVGVVIGASGTTSYQAVVSQDFQLSNVISGNGGQGVQLSASADNQVAMNYIGTDISGSIDLGNGGNGILVSNRSMRNVIGGSQTGGNNPTNDVFVRPPQGNLISGNNANGILLNTAATQNQISGNYIGTAASGVSALGNSLNGVAIVGANGNSLIGCGFADDPFVYYNVIAGNGNNGLLVSNSNDTTIQANFFGLGADNDTAVGNLQNGVVVEGTSTRTVMGGPIPLGNVVAANHQNGIVVKDTASFFTTYNTFCGLAAFSDNTTLGNLGDGMLITSTGSNILIRTNVITENGDDGVEISGAARGVRVAGNIIGLNTQGLVTMGNHDNGVEIGGDAQGIIVGGPQPTFNVIPQNAISGNGGYGVAVVGRSHHNVISNSYIGTTISGLSARPNQLAGVLLGTGTSYNTIGSPDPTFVTLISGNLTNGVEMRGSHHNTVIGNRIGTDFTGALPLGNSAHGVFLGGYSSDNQIGNMATNVPSNRIAYNGGNGVYVETGSRNGIHLNEIYGNWMIGIDLSIYANNQQAAPVLTQVQNVAGNMLVLGTINSKPNATFSIELFANDTNAASGRYYLGSLKVRTNALGAGSFIFKSPFPSNGSYVTATATDASNNTSEFSNAVS